MSKLHSALFYFKSRIYIMKANKRLFGVALIADAILIIAIVVLWNSLTG